MIGIGLMVFAGLVGPPSGPAELVADLGHSRPDIGYDFMWGTPWAEIDGVAYFHFDDGIHGLEPWRTDGTALGTYLLRDVCPGVCSGSDWYLLWSGVLGSAAGTLYFVGNDGIHGPELWRSDGTALGTEMVLDMTPGSAGTRFFGPMVEASGQLFFLATTSAAGGAIWRSDGTAKGTAVFWDPEPGSASTLRALARGPSWLWVSTQDELWRVDGTPEGTFPVGPAAGSPFEFIRTEFGANEAGEIVFVANGELHASDATPAGTGVIDAQIDPGHRFVVDRDVVLYPSDHDPESSPRSVWRYTGDLSAPEDLGLAPVADAQVYGPLMELDSGVVIATARSAATGSELWAIPVGGPAALLTDIWPGSSDGLPFLENAYGATVWKEVAGGLVFLADDGQRGLELYFTDGTPGGTEALPELVPGPTGVVTGSYNQRPELANLPGPLLFRHLTLDGVKLAISDGTAVGTRNVKTIGFQTSVEPPLRRWEGCRASRGPDLVVWSYSGSGADLVNLRAGREPLTLFASPPGTGVFGPVACAEAGAALLALLPVGDTRATLVATDGVAGAEVLLEVDMGYPMLSRGADAVWSTGSAIWYSDGTVPGTATIPVGSWVGEAQLVNAGLVLFPGGVLRGSVFEPLTGGAGTVVPIAHAAGFLVLDGTRWAVVAGVPATLTPIGILGGAAEVPEDLVRLRSFGEPLRRLAAPLDPGRALLVVDDGSHGAELWLTDGTAGGSTLVRELRSGPIGGEPSDLVQLRDGLVAFAADDGLHGRELWISDGTSAGTAMFDLLPGADSSRPERLTVIDGVLVFSAWSDAYGRELWWSDGTAAGTTRISNVAPGPKSSSPMRLVRAGRRLYFLATDHVRGFEWWSIDVPAWAGIFADGFESGDLAPWSAVEP